MKSKPSTFIPNSQGFNDKEYPHQKKNNVTRIVALGDSFNWAGEYKRNYWTLAENNLKKIAGFKNIEILNQGTPGVNPDYLLRLLKKESIFFSPDIVILAFFVGNDFNNLNAVPFVRMGYPVLDIETTNKRFYPMLDSYLWFYISRNIERFEDALLKKQEKKTGKRMGTYSRSKFLDIERKTMRIYKELFYTSPTWETTKTIFMKFSEFLSKKNIDFWVVLLPDECQVVDALQDELFNNFPIMVREQYDFELPQKMLGTYLKSVDIHYLDLLPVFTEQSESGKELYKWSNTHFNDRGNKLAAKEVSQFIAKQLE